MNNKSTYQAGLFFLLLFTGSLLPGCAQKDRTSFSVTLKIDSAKPGDTVTFSYTKITNGEPEFVNEMGVYKAEGVLFKGSISEPAEATLSRYVIEKVDTAFQMRFLEELQLQGEELQMAKEIFLSSKKPDQYTFFLLPGETTIKASQKIRNAKAEGPEALSSYIKLKEQYERLSMNLTAGLYLQYGKAERDEKTTKQMLKVRDSIDAVCKDSVYLNFLKENPASLVSLHALKQYLPVRIDNAEKYISLFNQLSPEIRQWESAKRLLGLLKTAQKVEIGQVVEDFQQLDSTGKKVALSSFRGKYVLIELWASWCVPCRKKNPGLRVIQDKYAGKNFTILGVALEERGDRIKWLEAIKKDQLNWPQLSDFKGWDNAVARQFGVQSIPFNMLIDPKGTIIAKNVYEEELEAMLSKIL